MRWETSSQTERDFIRTARKNPLTVFVSAIWKGRELSLSLPGALELDPDMRVVGPNSSWMVGVTAEGRKLRLTPFRLHARRRVCGHRVSK
jgi:hypothetical protein